MKIHWAIFLLLGFFFVACQEEETLGRPEFPALMEIPEGFPMPEVPADNGFTQERWELGKKLFYDPALSVDSSISCASCHRQDLAFSDDLAFSVGVDQRIGTRNSPSLANVAYHPYFTREGGVPTLEMQIFVPVQEHNELNFNILLLGQRLAADSIYTAMSLAAYDRLPDAFVVTRALACFERSLLSGNSPYDQYVQDGDERHLGAAALRGKALFFSDKTQCSTCHAGFNFTDYRFANNGLYEVYPDPGRFRLTGDEQDRALFKVPSLRNIALTAPYMHDGSLPTLEAVVAHYQQGGAAHPNKSELVQTLFLTDREQQDLVAFLAALTDPLFVTNPIFTKK